MANVKLPKKLDPIKNAQKQSIYDGLYLAHEMKRFSSSVVEVSTNIPVKVEFAKDAQGLTYFKGHISADVQLVCQRCNQPFEYSVYTEFSFAPVQGNDDEELIPDVYDPVQVDDHGEIDLFQVLEDELILALPIVALHSQDDCTVKAEDLQFGEIEPEPERENPFAVLKELKRN